jgi:DNA-3-methyladenine glycosylase II
MQEVTLTVPVTAPFRLDLTVWVLRRQGTNVIDQWDGRLYARVLVFDHVPVKLTVAQSGTSQAPELAVRLQSYKRLPPAVPAEAHALLQKLLGLSVVLQPFYSLASHEPALERLARQFVGVRPPRFPTVFEALVNAIACQQVSLAVGILLLNRLAERVGMAFSAGDETMHAFPRPADLLDVPEGQLKQLGFSAQKARAVKELAFSVANEESRLELLERAENDEALAYLKTLRGVGRWSAEYVLLRGLGRLNVFPGDDVGGQNNVQQLLGLSTRPGYDELQELTAQWSPYAGFVYFHLLLEKLHAKRLV